MSIRFQADNDLKRIIVDATLRSERIDFQTAQAARLDNLDDETVLRAAASQSRIREVVETLLLIWADDKADCWTNLILKIPF